MVFNLDLSISILERTPAILDAWLRELPEVWTHANEGEGTWSAYDVVGHLIHGERTDWIPRLRIILEHGEARTFEPFDRFAQERESVGKSLEKLLGEFAALRAESIEALRRLELTAADLERRGRHPELGVVSARQLLATWTAHDSVHIGQISRVLARQYRDEVGPWKQYLPVMQP